MKTQELKTLLAILCLALFLSSCATLFSPKSKPVVIKTEPAGAELYDSDNKLLGTTPFEIKTIDKKRKALTIKKEGFDSTGIEIIKKAHNEYLFLDAMLFCIPCIVDFSVNKFTYLEGIDYTILLRKKLKVYDKGILVAIGKSEIEFSDQKNIGKINGLEKKLKDPNFERIAGRTIDLDEDIVAVMKTAYLEPSYEGELEYDRSSFKKPKLIIRPVITDVNFDYTGGAIYKYKGTGLINVKWKIFKALDKNKAIGEIVTKTAIYRKEGNKSLILSQLIADATRDLLGVDTLYDYLKNSESNYYENLKGDEILIQQPSLVKTSSLKEVLKNASAAVVTIEHDDGFGSGVIISRDGYLITNYHVVGEQKSLTIKLNQDIKLNAEVVKINKDFDLALLKINAADLKALRFGDSDSTGVGDDIYAIGTPMDAILGQSVTKGIISGYREIKEQKFIQTDVSINPGNSGGPLINDKGEIVGIATMKLIANGVEGIGFGIPANTVMEMLNIKWKK